MYIDQPNIKDFDDGRKEKIIPWYINALYSIELLRNANINNVDLQTTWQYGQEFLTPWKDNPTLIEEFMHRHHTEVRMYIYHKLLRVVNRLLEGLPIIVNRDLFTMTPLEPNITNSIFAGMDDIVHTGDFRKRLLDEYEMDISKPNSTIRTVTGNFAGYEVLDRLMCGIFDKFPEMARELDDKKDKKLYGVHRHELLDNKVYLCAEALSKTYGDQISFPIIDAGRIFTNFGAWACIFSLLYRLSVPVNMHPNRMDTLYDKYILRDSKSTRAIECMRDFSTLTVEAVADSGLPYLNREAIKESVLKQGHSVTATYPNGLIEKYLVSRYLVEKG